MVPFINNIEATRFYESVENEDIRLLLDATLTVILSDTHLDLKRMRGPVDSLAILRVLEKLLRDNWELLASWNVVKGDIGFAADVLDSNKNESEDFSNQFEASEFVRGVQLDGIRRLLEASLKIAVTDEELNLRESEPPLDLLIVVMVLEKLFQKSHYIEAALEGRLKEVLWDWSDVL